jgi:hypothetical protein
MQLLVESFLFFFECFNLGLSLGRQRQFLFLDALVSGFMRVASGWRKDLSDWINVPKATLKERAGVGPFNASPLSHLKIPCLHMEKIAGSSEGPRAEQHLYRGGGDTR